MQLLISDANILIDMDVGGLLQKMFRLKHQFGVPDVLFVEELVRHHPTYVACDGSQGLRTGGRGGAGRIYAFDTPRRNRCQP